MNGGLMRIAILAAAIAISVHSASAAAAPAPAIAAATASADRSADNVKLDESRKPAEVLAFLGLKPGMHVLDLFGGNRYWAEITAPAVGSKGQVKVWEPSQFYDADSKAAFEAFIAKHPNVTITASPFEAPSLPTGFADVALINLDYHDVYWQSEKYGIPRMEPADFLAKLYAAMKPGGVVGVIDHVAKPSDDTRGMVEKYHRIDPDVVKADFERAGFVFEGSSDILRNPADDHETNVFDPKIRGKTDRFMFKFRKPS